MATWRPIREKSQKLLPGDVLRWAEKVWKETGRGKRKKALLAGGRDVTAEVLRDDGKLIALKVLKCSILASVFEPLKPLKVGATIKRKRETIVKGAGHRMLWSDESARSIVASRFLEPEPAPPPKAGAALRPGNWRSARSRSGGTARQGYPRGRGPTARSKGR